MADGLLNAYATEPLAHKISDNLKEVTLEKSKLDDVNCLQFHPCRRDAKRRNHENASDLEQNSNDFEMESYQKASKIAKFSLPEVKSSSCLKLNRMTPTQEHFTVLPPPSESSSSSTSSLSSTTATSAATTTRTSRVERRSKKKRVFIELRKSLVINEEQSTSPATSRPQSIASPPLTVPITSSMTGFQFQVDMTTYLSSDSAFSSSSSTQKSSKSSITSSVHSLSLVPQTPSTPSSSSSSLQSLNSPNPPLPPAPYSSPASLASVPPLAPPPSPSTDSLLSPLLRSTASRHSSRDDELRNNCRVTQTVWSNFLGDSRCGALDDVTGNFQTMTIDRKCLRDKTLAAAKKKFNSNPAKGIEYLIQSGFIKGSADSVAEFLFREEGLKKSSIGDFLGERKDFNVDVLKSFIKLHNFKNLTLVQALRQFLWSFRLPGESQKIDRIMENFSSKFCSDNPEEYSGSDTCFVLSFALVMLNTSLHNSNVKDKLTPERFGEMVRMICQDQKVTNEQLLVLYKSIKKDPLRFPEESGPEDFISTFFNPTKEGWLYKKSEKYNQWRKRWFVLSNGCLYYFTYKTDQQPRAIVPLENLEAQKSHDKKREHCLEIISTSNNRIGRNNNNNINNNNNNNSNNNNNNSNNNNNINNNTSTGIIKSCKTQVFGKVVEGTRTSFKLAAFSAKDSQEWIDCINKNSTNNPLQKMMVERRSKTLLSMRSRKRITSIVAPVLPEDSLSPLPTSINHVASPILTLACEGIESKCHDDVERNVKTDHLVIDQIL